MNITDYTAETGRGGGPQINITAKSAGQQYHGAGYRFRRHGMFNATNFFNNRNGLPEALRRCVLPTSLERQGNFSSKLLFSSAACRSRFGSTSDMGQGRVCSFC